MDRSFACFLPAAKSQAQCCHANQTQTHLFEETSEDEPSADPSRHIRSTRNHLEFSLHRENAAQRILQRIKTNPPRQHKRAICTKQPTAPSNPEPMPALFTRDPNAPTMSNSFQSSETIAAAGGQENQMQDAQQHKHVLEKKGAADKKYV